MIPRPDPGLVFDDYQNFTKTTATYPGVGTKNEHAIIYCTLGLNGEVGEIAEKVKKLIRDEGGFEALTKIDDEKRRAFAKELGDVMWYLARLSGELGFSLSEIARMNVEKLSSRKVRGAIRGSGDDR